MHVGFSYQNRLTTFLRTHRNKPHPKPRSESPGTDFSMFIRRAAGKSGVTVEKPGSPDYPGLKRGLSGLTVWSVRTKSPECPGTPIKWPFDSYLISLLLVILDPHMYLKLRIKRRVSTSRSPREATLSLNLKAGTTMHRILYFGSIKYMCLVCV